MKDKLIKDVLVLVVSFGLFGPVWRIPRQALFVCIKQLKTHSELTHQDFERIIKECDGQFINGYLFLIKDYDLIIV